MIIHVYPNDDALARAAAALMAGAVVEKPDCIRRAR